MLDRKMTEEIRRLGKVVCNRQEKLKEAEKALEDYARSYMTEHHMWDNPEDIIEIISYLPKGYFRFQMYETYYELQKTREEPEAGSTLKEPTL